MGQVTERELDGIVSDLNIEIDAGAEGGKRKLTTFQEMKEVFAKEQEFWSKHNQGPLHEIHGHFSFATDRLQLAEQGETSEARGEITRVADRLRESRLSVVYSSTPTARLLVMASEKGPEMVEGALNYLRNVVMLERRPRAYFDGVLWAAMCLQPRLLDHFLNLDRTGFERLHTEITDLRNSVGSWRQNITDKVEEWMDNSQADIAKLLKESREHFSTAHNQREEAFQTFDCDTRERTRALEDLFKEKLRLQAPAEYWEEMEGTYKSAGGWWTVASCVTTIVVLVGIILLLYFPPTALQQSTVTTASVKAAILIAVGISIAVYLINLFVRMATSSIHLSRDARERLQLTHMFLSLVKENAIEPKEREIVLQALFSRADTGLLKHEGTPAMASPLTSIIDSLRPGR